MLLQLKFNLTLSWWLRSGNSFLGFRTVNWTVLCAAINTTEQCCYLLVPTYLSRMLLRHYIMSKVPTKGTACVVNKTEWDNYCHILSMENWKPVILYRQNHADHRQTLRMILISSACLHYMHRCAFPTCICVSVWLQLLVCTLCKRLNQFVKGIFTW